MSNLEYRQYPDGRVVKYGLRGFDESYLVRPQTKIMEWRSEIGCSFHRGEDRSHLFLKDFPHLAGGMILEGAKYRSHEAHAKVIPIQCWNEQRIRELGGVDVLNDILEEVYGPSIREGHFVDLVHYNGADRSGASVPDFHMHLMVNQRPRQYMNHEINSAMNAEFAKSPYLVTQSGNIVVVVESIFQVGEVQIIQLDSGAINLHDLATIITTTIQMFGKAFANTSSGLEGLAPDFQLELEFLDGQLYSGGIVFMLAGVGVEQRRNRPAPHQWTPAETHKRLIAFK